MVGRRNPDQRSGKTKRHQQQIENPLLWSMMQTAAPAVANRRSCGLISAAAA
jgi:hypothetical protein